MTISYDNNKPSDVVKWTKPSELVRLSRSACAAQLHVETWTGVNANEIWFAMAIK